MPDEPLCACVYDLDKPGASGRRRLLAMCLAHACVEEAALAASMRAAGRPLGDPVQSSAGPRRGAAATAPVSEPLPSCARREHAAVPDEGPA